MVDYATSVSLYDVNYQLIDSLEVKTNRFGSYAGNFKLPEGRLNGQFRIVDSKTGSEVYFSVEEYKRPRFEVKLDKPSGSYKINDSIKVIGTATTFAGVPVDNAKLSYRVVRKVRFPWWYHSYGKFMTPYSREEMEMANGISTTDAAGKFEIDFKAIADEAIDRKNLPVFTYEVIADITDNAGETRSATQQVAVSYQNISLQIEAPQTIKPEQVKNIKIWSRNANGLFEKTDVSLQIDALRSPDKIYRQRYWTMPDMFIMTKQEHDRYFPDDPYSNEDIAEAWPVLKNLATIHDTTGVNGDFNIPAITEGGYYRFTLLTKDVSGDTVKDVQYVFVETPASLASNAPLFISTSRDSLQPGQALTYKVSTGFDQVNTIESIQRPEKDLQLNRRQILKAKPYSNSLNISEDDRGGLNLDYFFIKNNRQYRVNKTIAVEWSNKALDLSLVTFRDKTLPGSKETWTLKLRSKNADKIAAEALLTMYDVSLDQFRPHQWAGFSGLFPHYYFSSRWSPAGFNNTESMNVYEPPYNYKEVKEQVFDRLMNNGWSEASGGRMYYASAVKGMRKMAAPAPASLESAVMSDAVAGNVAQEALQDTTGSTGSADKPAQNEIPNPARTNLQELAFFYPQLSTDAGGNINFTFTMPEALTTWKLMAFAHTADLASGSLEHKLVTQKELMIQPNAPRFVREGDNMEFSAKVSNVSNKELTGVATLELLDAVSGKPLDGLFKNVFQNQYFTVAAGQSAAVQFPITIPYSFNSALTYRVKATTRDNAHTDGEEATLPVLTNRMLVTESLPLNLRNTNTKTYRFDKLLNASNSGSLSHQSLTVEFTANPVWYAVQALPYLMEYPYECAEQTFNRFYANAIASHIVRSMPKIRSVFEQWKTIDTTALMSNLQKNIELKTALLEETPWVLQAKSEAEQKKNIALLFDMVKLAAEQDKNLAKLLDMQMDNGAFPWFRGGRDDRYITQYIVAGIGHLRKLNALSEDQNNKLNAIVQKALPYMDAKLTNDYDLLIRQKVKLSDNSLSYIAVHYLYTRSFFNNVPAAKDVANAAGYYEGQAKKYWLQNSRYVQAMIALALHRKDDKSIPQQIIRSLKENAIKHPELGMYYKDYDSRGWFWYQAPVETQAMIIEALTDIDDDKATINDLKTWLLKQKQLQNWESTKATAEAVYALLLQGSNWLENTPDVKIDLGNFSIVSKNGSVTTSTGNTNSAEAGTGYLKHTIDGDKVQKGMGNINVSISGNANEATAWGAVYWQYFEDLDKITAAATPLQLNKQLFIQTNSDKGPVLKAINNNEEIKVGDKLIVRIELKVDRDMEYVHMKDMRSAAMEPVNVISSYKWQDGLGYYESTKDASTNFFFSWLPRGMYVFEYPMFATHSGNFSNGITTIQCMYAPEFSAHSEGIRVNINGQ